MPTITSCGCTSTPQIAEAFVPRGGIGSFKRACFGTSATSRTWTSRHVTCRWKKVWWINHQPWDLVFQKQISEWITTACTHALPFAFPEIP